MTARFLITLYYPGTDDICVESGFHGDLNETYPVGRIDEESQKLIQTTRECLDNAIKLCKPGTLFRDLGRAMYVFTSF
jgi:methionine aminopeptidase